MRCANNSEKKAHKTTLQAGSQHTTEENIRLLRKLKLSAMADALISNSTDAAFCEMGFNDQLNMLLNCESSKRRTSTYHRRLKDADLHSLANQEVIISRKDAYHLSQTRIDNLMSCEWIRNGCLILIIGKSGCGKTDLASAIVDAACRQGLKAKCIDYSKLMIDLVSAQKKTDSPSLYEDRKKFYTRYDLLFIDDVCIEDSISGAAFVFKELIEQCRENNRCGLILASQLKPGKWLSRLGGTAETSEAVVERVMNNYELISLDGRSHRASKPRNSEEVSK